MDLLFAALDQTGQAAANVPQGMAECMAGSRLWLVGSQHLSQNGTWVSLPRMQDEVRQQEASPYCGGEFYRNIILEELELAEKLRP